MPHDCTVRDGRPIGAFAHQLAYRLAYRG